MTARIAYLGDDHDFRRLLASVLAANDYSLEAHTSPRAVAASVTGSPDAFTAIIVDMNDRASIPPELFGVMSMVPIIMLSPSLRTPAGGDDDFVKGFHRLPRPLSVPRLMKLLHDLSARHEKPPDTGGSDRGKTALVVDDDPGFRLYVQEILSSVGYDVRTASDGIEALEVLDTWVEPGVFVVDLAMPRMNGPELIEKLTERFSSPSIIIMTGTQDMNLLEWSKQSGRAYAIVEKPFRSRTFLRYVSR